MKAAKFIVAALTAALTALTVAITDGMIDRSEWLVIALAALGALGVYWTPNTPPE